MKIDNPAARLYVILEGARESQAAETVETVFKRVLQVEGEDTANLLHSIGYLMRLNQEAQEEIRALTDVDHEMYLRPYAKVDRLLSKLNFETQWNSLKNIIDEATMQGLAFGIDRLSRERPEKVVSPEELAALQQSVQELIERILQSELDAEIKTLLLNHLEHIRLAIIQYRISGSKGLIAALDSSLGSMLRHREDIAKASDKEVFRDFFGILAKIHLLVTYANDARELLAPVVSFFLPELPPAE